MGNVSSLMEGCWISGNMKLQHKDVSLWATAVICIKRVNNDRERHLLTESICRHRLTNNTSFVIRRWSLEYRINHDLQWHCYIIFIPNPINRLIPPKLAIIRPQDFHLRRCLPFHRKCMTTMTNTVIYLNDNFKMKIPLSLGTRPGPLLEILRPNASDV